MRATWIKTRLQKILSVTILMVDTFNKSQAYFNCQHPIKLVYWMSSRDSANACLGKTCKTPFGEMYQLAHNLKQKHPRLAYYYSSR